MIPITTTTRTTPLFRDEAEGVFSRVRSATGEILAALPGVRRPSDLRDALKIDYRLSWRLFKVAEDGVGNELFAIGSHIPGTVAMGRFLDRAKCHGIPHELIQAARDAGAEFDALVKRHAPNRAAFDAMVAAAGGWNANRLDWEHKRALYRAAAGVHGIQAHTTMLCAIISPAAGKDRIDIATLRGMFGIRRLRPNAPLMVTRHSLNADYANKPVDTNRQPFDLGAYAEHGISLIPEFCSAPLPAIRSSELSAGGQVQIDLVGDDVGLESEVSCVLGHVSRDMPSPYTDDTLPRHRFNLMLRLPAEVLIQDVLIPTELYGSLDPKLLVLTDSSMLELARGHEETGLLAIQESVTHLGRGLGVMHTPDVPRYGEMLRYTFGTLGWDPNKFEVYRCRVEYPVMHSVVSMQFELPERPLID